VPHCNDPAQVEALESCMELVVISYTGCTRGAYREARPCSASGWIFEQSREVRKMLDVGIRGEEAAQDEVGQGAGADQAHESVVEGKLGDNVERSENSSMRSCFGCRDPQRLVRGGLGSISAGKMMRSSIADDGSDCMSDDERGEYKVERKDGGRRGRM